MVSCDSGGFSPIDHIDIISKHGLTIEARNLLTKNLKGSWKNEDSQGYICPTKMGRETEGPFGAFHHPLKEATSRDDFSRPSELNMFKYINN